MRRWHAVAVVASFVAAGALVAAAAVDRPSVSAVRHRWGHVDGNGTELVTEVTVRNPNAVAVRVLAADYVVSANGAPLARGALVSAAALPAGGEGVVTVATRIDADDALSWLRAHLAANETTRFEVAGDLRVLVAGVPFAVPLADARAWRTNLTEELGARLRTCPDAPTAPCLAGSEHRWTEVDGVPRLASTFEVVNPLGLPVPVGGDLTLQLAGEPVVAGSFSGWSLVPAHGRADMSAEFAVDEAALAAWWPKHVAACERSPAEVQANLLGGLVRIATPIDPVETRFAC